MDIFSMCSMLQAIKESFIFSTNFLEVKIKKKSVCVRKKVQ